MLVALLLAIGLQFLASAPLFSQGSTGRVLGTVTDQSGGAVAGAAVTITDTERGTTRTLSTDESGEYNAPSLIASTYKVHVEAKGFKLVDRQNVILEVNGNVRVDVKLQPGDVSQTITVTEEIPLVETTNAELGGTLQNTIIENLPLNGRNFENLLTLRPGVEIYVGGGGWTQSTNGVRPHDNMYLVEGVNSNDPYMAQSIMNAAMAAGDAGTILPVDAIQEFKTEVNPSAQYGWKPGAVVSVGIKSGTNSYHGTAYAYGRSDSFDARNYFNGDVNSNPGCVADPVPCTKTPVELEQYGATFGAPLKKDKLFYFLNFEAQRYSVGNPQEHNVPVTTHLPTPTTPNCPNGFAGNCRKSLTDACNDALLAGPLTNNAGVMLAGLDPATCNPLAGQPANGFLGMFPVRTDPTTDLVTGINSNNRVYSGLAKIDYHLNDKNTLSGMYFISPGSGIFVDDPAHQYVQQWLTNQYARSQVGSGNWTWVPGSNWVNEARVGYSHYYQVFKSGDSTQDPSNYTFNGSTYHLYTGQTNAAYFGFPRIRIKDFPGFQIGASWPKTVGPDGVLQIADQVSYLHGKHAFKFGGEILRNTSTNNVTANTKGPARFGHLTDFFAGNAQNSNTGFLTGDLLRHMSFEGYAAFLQDDWRLTPRLTVNLGLRYELDTVFKENDNLIGNFDPNSATGLVQVGKGISSPFDGNHHNFSPRVGFAWDINGNGKTVVRAGGSLIYEQLSLDSLNGIGNTLGLRMVPTGAELFSTGDGTTFVQGPGTINVVATPGLAGTSPTRWTANTPTNALNSQTPQCGTGLQLGAATVPDPPPCDILGVDRKLRTPYVSTWTLGIQRALTNNMSLEVAYVGNHGTKLIGMRNINQPPIGAGWGSPTVVGTPAYNCTQSANDKTLINGVLTPTPYDNCASNGGVETASQTFTQSCPSPIGLGTGTAKCFPYLRYVELVTNQDRSNYHGLQVTLTQRASHGLSFTAGYTYAHALDDDGDNEGNGLHTPIDSRNPGALYASSDFDIRHRLTLSIDYAIPGRKGFGQILEGWAVNSIVTIETGSVWGPNDQSSDFTGTGESGNLVGSIGEPWYFYGNTADFTPVHGWTDTNSGTGGVPYFPGGSTDPNNPTSNATCNAKAAAIGTLALASLQALGCYGVGSSVMIPSAYGSLGPTLRNIFRDQGFKNWDMSVTKEFKFRERFGAQFRAEVFNILNRPWFANPYGGPGGGAADPSGGAGWGFVGSTPDVQASNPVLGSGGARAMQLGLKLTF
jgi:hypothetical protein